MPFLSLFAILLSFCVEPPDKLAVFPLPSEFKSPFWDERYFDRTLFFGALFGYRLWKTHGSALISPVD